MDQKDSSFRLDGKLKQVHFLQKAFQILIPIYIVSLFVSQPSLLYSVLSYLDHYMSTFSIKLFHYDTERNYIFLLFNGILAVILKNSGLIRKSTTNSSYEESSKKEKNLHFPEVSGSEFSRRKVEVTGKVVKGVEEHGKQNGILVTVEKTEEEVSERATELTKTAEVEEDDGKNELVIGEVVSDEDQELLQEQEQEQEDEEGLMSSDELNRKCDEFIKKMRAGIKVDFHN